MRKRVMRKEDLKLDYLQEMNIKTLSSLEDYLLKKGFEKNSLVYDTVENKSFKKDSVFVNIYIDEGVVTVLIKYLDVLLKTGIVEVSSLHEDRLINILSKLFC